MAICLEEIGEIASRFAEVLLARRIKSNDDLIRNMDKNVRLNDKDAIFFERKPSEAGMNYCACYRRGNLNLIEMRVRPATPAAPEVKPRGIVLLKCRELLPGYQAMYTDEHHNHCQVKEIGSGDFAFVKRHLAGIVTMAEFGYTPTYVGRDFSMN